MSALFSVRLVVLDFFGDCNSKVDVETVQNKKNIYSKTFANSFFLDFNKMQNQSLTVLTHCYIAIIIVSKLFG